MSGNGGDPTIHEALAMLRRAMAGGGTAEGPWQDVPEVGPDDPWLVSATDLLTPWSPLVLDPGSADAPARPAPGDDPRTHWDLYFRELETNGLDDRAADPGPDPPTDVPPPQVVAEAPAAPSALDEPLREDDADDAVACVYDFTHALGRGDVPAVMACIAERYHAMERDRAIGRRTLQHQIEQLIDERRGCVLDASLAAVPVPVAFPGGLIVIPVTIQLDARPPEGMPTTMLIQRIAVLERETDAWKIAALAHPPDPAEAAAEGGRNGP